MSAALLRVRIRTEDKDDVEWSVRQDELTFGNTLFAISKVLPHVAVTAFEYEDEERDRITVRSDEELHTMLADFFSFAEMEQGYPPPLVIYPRVGKTPQDRNIHGLKIKTKKQDGKKAKVPVPTEVPPAENVELRTQSKSQSRSSGEIEVILACGNITDSDLQYMEVLGNGTGGTVFRASHIQTGKMMAVKVIQLDITPDVQKQIISELKVLDQCQCDSIIMFYGAFFVENRISICAELMDGGALDQFGQIPEPILGRMTVSIVRGLVYLWSKKIMHRDIKPSNILVNTQGQVKLCDFGVSTQLVNSIAKTYVGTNAYMAPERILGEDYSLPSEVWSLGVTLFELATGRFPYNAALFVDQPMQFLNCIVREPPPRLPAGFFSADLIEFVARCMQQSPQDRLKPTELESHSFILRHSDGQMEQVVTWVQGRLQEIQTQQATANR